MALYVYNCSQCDEEVELIRDCEDRDKVIRHSGCKGGRLKRNKFPGSNWSMGDVLLSGSYRQHEGDTTDG